MHNIRSIAYITVVQCTNIVWDDFSLVTKIQSFDLTHKKDIHLHIQVESLHA